MNYEAAEEAELARLRARVEIYEEALDHIATAADSEPHDAQIARAALEKGRAGR